MLIWVNGPFGGGKTQTAYELRRRLRVDFQDMPAWRQGVFEVLDLVLDRHPGPVIAPMTLVEPAYFDEIIGRLRDRGRDVHHFALLADRQTVLRRLRERGLGHLAASAGLTPAPNADGALRGRLRRAWVGARHIRLR